MDLADGNDFIPQIIERVPNIRVVIDHIANPAILVREFEPWLTGLCSIASIESVGCKLSGMVTEGKSDSWAKGDFVPYFHHVLGLFGADRLIFGSDWPLCTLAAEHGKVTELALFLTRNLSAVERRKIFGDTAADFYGLE